MELPIKIHKRPRLTNPNLIIGWADAGLVGSSAVEYLIEKLGAEELGKLDPHGFSALPYVFIRDGVIKEIEYPDSSFYYWENNNYGNDLILWSSKSPVANHYQMVNAILDVADLFGVTRIYTVGGLYANITHTEKPGIFAIVNSPDLKKLIKQHNIESGMDYHGPTSMNGLTLGLAQQRGIEGVSLWGRVPSYIGDIANPQVTTAILKVLTRMLDIDIDFSEIESEASYARKQIDELVSYIRQQDPDLDQHIKKLETGAILEITEEDSQRFFREIEDYLRKQQGRRESD